MSDKRYSEGTSYSRCCNDVCCIDADRIFDSCRDRDCYENLRVNLSDFGNDIIGRTGNVRAKDAYIAWTYINVDKVRFNRGFYTVNIRYYIKLIFEACIGNNKPHEFEGVVAVDKKVVLFGGEKNVNVFRSESTDNSVCDISAIRSSSEDLPRAVVEATDPIILDVKVFDKSTLPSCCCCCCDIPDSVMKQLECPVANNDADLNRYLTVSIGMFSVIRLIRSAQLLINATEYCVPDKECITPCDENPCSIFNKIAFPSGEFCSQSHGDCSNLASKCK